MLERAQSSRVPCPVIICFDHLLAGLGVGRGGLPPGGLPPGGLPPGGRPIPGGLPPGGLCPGGGR
ncbi:MAG: hypothetical protein PVJ25_07905 [Desulfuromonadales bacterium]